MKWFERFRHLCPKTVHFCFSIYFVLISFNSAGQNIPLKKGENSVASSYLEQNDILDFGLMNPVYRPIVCLPCNQYSYPYQAYLYFKLPVLENYHFLNIRFSFGTGTPTWLFKNIVLAPYPNPTPMRIMTDLQPITELPDLSAPLLLEWLISTTQLPNDDWIGNNMTLPAVPFELCIGSGAKIGFHPMFLPFTFPPDGPVIILPPILGHLRGCEVPNIDLDSLSYPIDPDIPSKHDHNACGPAAAANSLHWLDNIHDEIQIDGGIRETLDTLKKMMKLDSSGVTYENLVKGKLEFIDKHQLPIRVKFQSHFPQEFIESPNPLYGSKAENHSPPGNHPTYDWLGNELEEDEDVELMYGYYCDTLVMDTMIVDGETIITERTKLKRRSGHVINVTGYVQVGNRKFITYKHDPDQSGSGGTEDENGDPITDLSDWIEDDRGYAYLKAQAFVGCTTYVETIVSESYDPDVTFCKKKVTSPGDNGDGTLRDAIACAKNGDIIMIDPLLSGSTILLTSGPISINIDLTIMSALGLNITIEAGDSVDRVFDFGQDADVTISAFSLIGGESTQGNVIYNAGNLTLDNVSIINNPEIPGITSGIYNNSTGQLLILNQTNIKD